MELARLLRLATDASAARDLALTRLAIDEAAKCLMKLAEAQSALECRNSNGQQWRASPNPRGLKATLERRSRDESHRTAGRRPRHRRQ
jgi:hypothetical protein